MPASTSGLTRKEIGATLSNFLATIAGCGIKGPLYQTPEQQQENSSKTSDESNKSTLKQ